MHFSTDFIFIVVLRDLIGHFAPLALEFGVSHLFVFVVSFLFYPRIANYFDDGKCPRVHAGHMHWRWLVSSRTSTSTRSASTRPFASRTKWCPCREFTQEFSTKRMREACLKKLDTLSLQEDCQDVKTFHMDFQTACRGALGAMSEWGNTAVVFYRTKLYEKMQARLLFHMKDHPSLTIEEAFTFVENEQNKIRLERIENGLKDDMDEKKGNRKRPYHQRPRTSSTQQGDQSESRHGNREGATAVQSHEKKPTRRKEVDVSKVKCYNCHEVGHFASSCPKPKKDSSSKSQQNRSFNKHKEKINTGTAFVVSDPSVDSLEAVERPKMVHKKLLQANHCGFTPCETADVNQLTRTRCPPKVCYSTEAKKRLYVPLLIDGYSVNALLDSGAERSIMSQGLLEKLNEYRQSKNLPPKLTAKNYEYVRGINDGNDDEEPPAACVVEITWNQCIAYVRVTSYLTVRTLLWV